ncbi:MAG: M50 family metallopeptidase [Elusimicrobiaceae bacterium]|nr:M50 family metallopeptidase [Elusimicrobiaceae bacterium]
MSKVTKFLIGILLAPTALFTIAAFFQGFYSIVKSYDITLWFVIGLALYVLVHKYLYNFSRPYVFAHEITHALSAMCCGYKAQDLKVGEENGQVKVSGTNIFIFLAPYCLPLYAVILLLIYFFWHLFSPDTAFRYKDIFLFLFGFFIMLHVMHTVNTLQEAQQSDLLQAGGNIFSVTIIVLSNVLIIFGLLELCFPGILPLFSLFKQVISNTLLFWRTIFGWLYNLVNGASSK